MVRGQAFGVDREYQEYCRDFLVRTRPGLSAYVGDGCDVPFDIGGTTWTLDIALRDQNGELVAAECRRRGDPSKQNEIAAFAYQIELLRKAFGRPVSGHFFVKAEPQLGLVKVGTYEGIKVAVLDEGRDPSDGFSVAFLRYDQQREKRVHDYLVTVGPGRFELVGGSVNFTITRKQS
jgi:hypothetical protein